ncbi:MAG: hypothetical protein RLZZ210_1445 [Pseudomonadota bacterium]|jgi:uncharacterized protein HemX
MKLNLLKTSNIVSTLVVVSCIALSIYNYNKLIKVSYEFAKKENEWLQKYQLIDEKLKASNDVAKDFQQKANLLEQKNEDTSKSLHELQLSIAQMQMLQNADQLMAMQFKHILTMASEQLKITQDANSALSTLQAIDERLEKFPANHWVDVRRALSNDILNLKLQPTNDLSSSLERLNKNINLIDVMAFVTLPQNLENKDINNSASWFSRLFANIWLELTSLVRIRSINNPDSITLSKNEEWFVKENLKLLLNQAKLAAYNKNQQDFNNYIQQIKIYSNRYIDKTTKNAISFNKNIDDLSLVKFASNININQTLQAVINAAGQ